MPSGRSARSTISDGRSDPSYADPSGGHGGAHVQEHEGIRLPLSTWRAAARASSRDRRSWLEPAGMTIAAATATSTHGRRRRHRLRMHTQVRDVLASSARHGKPSCGGAGGRRARQGRLRQGRDPRISAPRREGRRGLRLRVRRAIIERMTMEERLTSATCHRGRGALRLRHRATTIEYFPAAYAARAQLRPGRCLVEDDGDRAGRKFDDVAPRRRGHRAGGDVGINGMSVE